MIKVPVHKEFQELMAVCAEGEGVQIYKYKISKKKIAAYGNRNKDGLKCGKKADIRFH